ncbi:hypothetical protein RB195_023054 [Necator americanus]|uniref:Reverse transcriptase domain-containing protein n=1 Tax=Necator americanus TaxID=51031 RepID=A0ABR1EJX8_NECAM
MQVRGDICTVHLSWHKNDDCGVLLLATKSGSATSTVRANGNGSESAKLEFEQLDLIPWEKGSTLTCAAYCQLFGTVAEKNLAENIAMSFCSPTTRVSRLLRTNGVPGKLVRLLDDMNQRTTTAVGTPGGCTTPFEVVTGVRQGAVAGVFLFNFATL